MERLNGGKCPGQWGAWPVRCQLTRGCWATLLCPPGGERSASEGESLRGIALNHSDSWVAKRRHWPSLRCFTLCHMAAREAEGSGPAPCRLGGTRCWGWGGSRGHGLGTLEQGRQTRNCYWKVEHGSWVLWEQQRGCERKKRPRPRRQEPQVSAGLRRATCGMTLCVSLLTPWLGIPFCKGRTWGRGAGPGEQLYNSRG